MAALVDLVNFQFENAKALSIVLEKESKIIASRVSADIEKIAKEKMTLIGRLQQTDQRIASHPHVNQLTEDTYLRETVASIQSIILDCQQINQINGEALTRAQSSFNKLNNMLQHSHGKIGMTYNAGGKTHTISTLGTNIKA
ncbi:flagellar export chaperone FlgN [Vibrio vulnificus]|uniref:Flagellar biosynthesis protein FlgN n=3 Tax=Vibrio vulnificus TaxID=672 RepID=A0A087IGU1_VIBVL|nr:MULTISPECIES: flagellar export chaperone FlgN [Vibrio]OJI60472.1 FlgN protein [Vibrio fluvialis]AAO08768.1 Flagellar biosynthesis protein flgN [Vibrio vulnificus CMCP6]ADV87293.1 flagellar biosynthesis protein FlgN [Vibrio vulnificus MO6-24/O]AIL69977.1 flagellar biosynthesis chaperone FlgN [Vibrio vulnificus]ALM71608.1 Flagellar biosynthesis protein FlgN [Vibrio vulnificus]